MLVLRETLTSDEGVIGSIELKSGYILVVRAQSYRLYKRHNDGYIYWKRENIAGIIVACCGYESKFDNREYIFTLSQIGTIRVMELNFQEGEPLSNVVSEFQSFINVTAKYPQFGINSAKGHLFINLSDFDVYVMKFYDKKNGIVIQEPIEGDDSGTWIPIYLSSGRIRHFELCEFQGGAENSIPWVELTLLVYTNGHWRFETARALTTIKIQTRWKCTRCLELPASKHIIGFLNDLHEYVMAYIPYFGYYIVSLTHIIIIAFKDGYLCNIGGTLVTELATFESIDNHCDLDSGTIGIASSLYVHENTDNLEFSLLTNNKEKIDFHLNIIQTDAYDSVTHLSNFNYNKEYINIDSAILDRTVSVQLSKPSGLLILSSTGTYFYHYRKPAFPYINTSIEETASKIIFDYGSISDEFPVEYYSGFDKRTNKHFLEYRFFGYYIPPAESNSSDKHLNHVHFKLVYEPLSTVTETWVDGNNIYWRDEFDTLFKNGQELLKNGQHKFIINNNIVSLNNLLSKISFFQHKNQHCYSYVSQVGTFLTSQSNDKYDIKNIVETPTLKNIVLASIVCPDNSLLSIIVVDDELIELKDYILVKKQKLDNSISRVVDLAINQIEGKTHLLVSDLEGKLFCIDLNTGKIVQRLSIGKLPPKFCQKKDYWVIYSREYMGLLVFDSKTNFYEYRILIVPYFIKSIHDYNNGIYLITEDNKVLTVNIDKINNTARPTTVNNKVEYELIYLTSLPYTNRFLVARIGRNTDMITQESLAVVDLFTGKILDVFSLGMRYENASISCISSIEYQNDKDLRKFKKGQTSYAKIYALSHCFIVSLDISNLEDGVFSEDAGNLLLFSIEEDTGKLTLEASKSSAFNVTTVQNYLNRTFFVGGDTLAIYQIDYLVKENRFIMEEVSTRPTGLNCVLSLQPYSCRLAATKSSKEFNIARSHRIVLQDKFKGLLEYEVIISNKNKGQIRSDDLKIELKAITNRDMLPFNNILENDSVINCVKYREHDGTSFFLLVYNSKLVLIAFINSDGTFGYHEFFLSCDIKLVTAQSRKEMEHYEDYLVNRSKNLFRLVTAKNTCYNISLEDMEVSEEVMEKMDEYLPEIAYVDGTIDDNSLKFVDKQIFDYVTG
ncbi:hypothetical protein RNJ44_04258 [Nakaseomyces bracarensis]|uniref:Cleavage/polyadenylation specificity factor A subunit C-terminal domain-containing protein n=1 Tax=Nakaseomyces bracarensis TaxID=273131 RepID=A0ABR4NUD3_9SACH